MNSAEINGHLVVVLRLVPTCDLETLSQTPDYILADDYSFYAGNIKFPTIFFYDNSIKDI